MFTGLVECRGTVLRLERHGVDARMILRSESVFSHTSLGESVAVDGVCLTVVFFDGAVFAVDISAETLSKTTLGSKNPGAMVNLERALRLGDRLGGHLVQGHVDAVGTLSQKRMAGRSWRFYFTVPEELSPFIVPKGSIAVNGVSLTVNGCALGRFDVNVIPHTAEVTTLGMLSPGDPVNIETDIIAKYVYNMLRAWKAAPSDNPKVRAAGVDEDFLKRHGFL
ncbi:riboflavin synthase [Desulfosoma caldarium]|uniref:Riboflavin synthase n=1 Tax=Desulfosoma caldarium TaxID=610254 RepID=A0A3N1US06_9BACT|nr:riboflavin synthase [Desulfosoma caldarium]ROQ90641.1 riboflavin synthase alpha chain [Desulfosoma caldarium]